MLSCLFLRPETAVSPLLPRNRRRTSESSIWNSGAGQRSAMASRDRAAPPPMDCGSFLNAGGGGVLTSSGCWSLGKAGRGGQAGGGPRQGSCCWLLVLHFVQRLLHLLLCSLRLSSRGSIFQDRSNLVKHKLSSRSSIHLHISPTIKVHDLDISDTPSNQSNRL